MSSFFHSIRWRVQAWHGLILLGVILAFCFTAYRLARSNQLRRVDHDLNRLERHLIRTLIDTLPAPDGKPPAFSPERLAEHLRATRPTIPAAISTLFSGTEPGFAYFSIRDADGRILLHSPNTPADLVFPDTPPSGEPGDDIRLVGHRRESLHGSPEGMRSIVGRDITPELEEMHRFVLSLAAAGLGVWALGLAGGWWLAGRAIQPIAAISRAATRIAEGNLAERIDASGSDSELDQLGRVLNRTFERLHQAFERQKRFTADASHELRTPVTVLLAETQRVLKRDRTAAEYRAALEICRDNAGRMRHLIEALLLLARQENAGADVPREPCDLAVIAADVATQFGPLALERRLSLRTDLHPAACPGDFAALSILATNLVANALQHHDRPGGCVHVATDRADGWVSLVVSDDGPGIPPDDLPHVFERFYRADKSRRSTASGHLGLGLAIARTIAGNHGGEIVAANRPERGACFTVRLPAAG